jgi:hypothetical protein
MHLGELKMRYALAILLTFPLAGCASLTSSNVTTKSACTVWRDVSWSVKDTDQTIREIKVNNARREGWCAGIK